MKLSALFAASVIALTALACGNDMTGPDVPSLVVEDVAVGTGATAVVGDTVTVHYRGLFLDGRQFDSSYDRGTPLPPFRLGSGAVIQGFDQGVVGMRVGGRRRLTIPSALAYGAQGAPPTIPPNTPLRFEIELLAIAGK